MWTYTTYIFGKYCEKCGNEEQKCIDLSFKTFSEFMFDVLWRKQKLVFHDGEEDLFSDFKYLQKLGIVEIKGEAGKMEEAILHIKDGEKLSQIVKIVEDSAALTGIKLFDEYTRRINLALKEDVCVASPK